MQLHLMEGTAQELQSLSSTFGFYALHHVRSHSGNMSDIWHCCSKAAARHWKHWKTLKMPVLLSLLPSLVCAVPGRRGLPKSGVGGCCHTLCACQGADTLAVDCDMSLTWNHAGLLQLGALHRLGRQQLQSVCLCVTDTPRGTRVWARPHVSGILHSC